MPWIKKSPNNIAKLLSAIFIWFYLDSTPVLYIALISLLYNLLIDMNDQDIVILVNTVYN